MRLTSAPLTRTQTSEPPGTWTLAASVHEADADHAPAVALQVWASWLLYAVLVDLSDAVAEQLDVPLQSISFEMVYRGLYYFTEAHQRGLADDPVAYLAAPAQSDLGIVKRRRKSRERDRRIYRPEEVFDAGTLSS